MVHELNAVHRVALVPYTGSAWYKASSAKLFFFNRTVSSKNKKAS